MHDWSMRVNEAGKELDVLFLCGLTVSPYKQTTMRGIRTSSMMLATHSHALEVCAPMWMLAPHGFYFDLEGKAARQTEGSANPFIDAGELGRHLAEMEKDFEQALQLQERQR